MNIRRGYYATLYDGKVYETTNIKKDKQGNYKLRSTNTDDLKNGFSKYNDNVFIKVVSEDEIEKIEHIEPYAILKDDPDKNKLNIIEKNDGLNYDHKLVLATVDYTLAEKFGFRLCGFGRGTYEKTFSENKVSIDYDIENIFTNSKKNYDHKNVTKALAPMSKTVHNTQVSKDQEKIVFGF